jgi:hypothetical protein
MTSEISYEEYDNYLKIKYSGYSDIEDFLTSMDEAYDLCERKNYSNLLLDVFNINFDEVKDMDKYLAGVKIEELFGKKNVKKIAILRPEERKNAFAKLVALNRGAVIEEFQDIHDAIEWFNK